MGNTHTALHCHVVFGTKNRERWLTPQIEERVWSYLGGIARANHLEPIQAGGFVDYIQRQRTHHGTKSFEDEFRALLSRHGIPFRERYPWD